MNHLSSSSMLAKDLMNSEAVPLTPGTFEKDLALQFLSGQYSGWPVVDLNRNKLGVVTEVRLLQAVSRLTLLDDLRVEDTMSSPVSVLENDPLDVVLNLMVQRQVLRMPVVGNRNLVGVIYGDICYGIVSRYPPLPLPSWFLRASGVNVCTIRRTGHLREKGGGI